MITSEDMVKSLQHRYGGNGWAVVHWINDDYVRVVSYDRENIGKQAFLAHTSLFSPELRPENPHVDKSPLVPIFLPPLVLDRLQVTMRQLREGELVIRATRFVKA